MLCLRPLPTHCCIVVRMNQDSIFTKIIKGEIPCHKVYEDEATIAFMDIHPVQPGMVLVVSKRQVDHFFDLSENDYQALMRTTKQVAQRIREVFPEKKRVAVQIEGLDVPHAHVKLFPFDTTAEFHEATDQAIQPDHEQLAKIAAQLAF